MAKKPNQFFTTRQEIKSWLDGECIKDYTIRESLIVDVRGTVYIESQYVEYLPVQFGKVNGDFFLDCSVEKTKGKLKSLLGSPSEVTGDFHCCNSLIKTLIGSPKFVGRNFNVSNNKISSLQGAPDKIGGDFNVSENFLTSLVDGPRDVGRDYSCHTNRIANFKGIAKTIGGRLLAYSNNLNSYDDLINCDFDGVLYVGQNPRLTYSWNGEMNGLEIKKILIAKFEKTIISQNLKQVGNHKAPAFKV